MDGQDNPLVSIATNRFYEVQKYITEPHYKLWTGPVVVSAEWLRSLPEDVQKAIIEAGRETTVEMRDSARQAGNGLPRLPQGKGHGLLRRARGRGRMDEARRRYLARSLTPRSRTWKSSRRS